MLQRPNKYIQRRLPLKIRSLPYGVDVVGELFRHLPEVEGFEGLFFFFFFFFVVVVVVVVVVVGGWRRCSGGRGGGLDGNVVRGGV